MTHDINRRRLLVTARWLCYALLLAVCYMLQTNRVLFDLGGIRPLWLPAACLVLAMWEDAFPSVLYGMFAGLLWDVSSNRLAGFFAICMMVCCFFCSSITQLVLRRTVFNTCMLTLGCLFLVTGLDFLFSYVLFSLPQSGIYYVGTLIPTIVYTVVACVPLYPLCSLMHRIGRTEN
ncbi:MAG: rod shape-determining protein MreD [Oscillospiraceae bacterium]|nr:rod shape-determining protein MreD [Oscillospiraceae bacterium]